MSSRQFHTRGANRDIAQPYSRIDDRVSPVDRRAFLRGAVGTAAVFAMPSIASCTGGAGGTGGDADRVLRAATGEVDLGGPTVHTWAYDGRVPGNELRVRAGKQVTVRLENQLPADTTVHWHGLRIANAMDGVPEVTQQSVAPEGEFVYAFTPPDPGTFWLHSHEHLQLDRGLYAPLIVEDPNEPGQYDDEWVLVLDDWVDGTGRTPEDVFHVLKEGPGHHGDGHDDHGGGGSTPAGDGGDGDGGHDGMDRGGHKDEKCLSHLGMHVSDVDDYPHYLINGRVRTAPEVLRAKPGQRVRLRIINASADTMFRVALERHHFTVTHTDGFPVERKRSRSLLLAMGERVDAIVELKDGVFPFVARSEGSQGTALALVRTGGGQAPPPDVQPDELDVCPVLDTGLSATDDVTFDKVKPDRFHKAVLSGKMEGFTWKINGEVFGEHTPLPLRAGERVRLTFINDTTMPHPMHLHGHTFQVLRDDATPGPRRDTTIVPAKQRVEVEFDADNRGDWVVHCHNEYHMAAGMMTALVYT